MAERTAWLGLRVVATAEIMYLRADNKYHGEHPVLDILLNSSLKEMQRKAGSGGLLADHRRLS